jgi:DNA-binding transcriptional MerR regulator
MFKTFFGAIVPVEERFTSNEVAELTGITLRQLQWWDERGVVKAQRDGRRRLYSATDALEIALIRELKTRGFSLQKVRRVMRLLQREFGQRLAATARAGECHLLTDGRSIYLETSPEQVIDVLTNARQPMLAVCLSDTARKLRGQLKRPQSRVAVRGARRKTAS